MTISSEETTRMGNWFSNQGLQVIYSDSCGWVEFSRGVFQAFPYFRLIDPSEGELAQIFLDYHALALRYSAPLQSGIGKLSYHVVCDKECFPLRCPGKKARHDLAHGLEYAVYMQIPIERLAYEGWSLRSETLIRQGRIQAEDEKSWGKLCIAAVDNPAFEAWGGIHEGSLVTALLACTVDHVTCILYQQSLTEHLKFGVNNALAVVCAQEFMKRSETQKVFYGLESLDAPTSVDEFKMRMGFSAQPVRQRVVPNPILRPFFKTSSHRILRLLLRRQPGSYTLAKAEGMLRFYLQGNLPIEKQSWPPLLLSEKQAIRSLAAASQSNY